MPNETLIRLFEDPARPGICRGCNASIEWHETPRGKAMPMNAGSVPRKSERVDGRVVGHYAASDSHWRSCPDAAKFKTGRR